jgi:hypothetical protein
MAKKDAGPLPMEQRMELFQAVVEMQDQGIGTVLSRSRVAKRFGVTPWYVRQVEEEGLRAEWPPL